MRNISEKLVDYIDDKLAKNGAAQFAIEHKDARKVMMYAAECLVGIREVGGNNKGPLVELIQLTVDGKANAESWCCSFVQSVIAYAELKTGIKSLIYSSEHCLTMFNKTPQEAHVKITPNPGAIVIWRHGKTTNGHTGVLLEKFSNEFTAVEGNTEAGLDPSGLVQRNGGGVYMTKRNLYGSGNMKVVGFLIPFKSV